MVMSSLNVQSSTWNVELNVSVLVQVLNPKAASET
jgi:hypothetical protein